jgi:hypothetical protein
MQTGPAGAAQDVLPTAVKIHPRLGDWLSNNQAKQLLWLHMRQNASWTWAYVVVPSLNCVISGALPKGCAVMRRNGCLCAAIANQRVAELETGVDDASAICSMGNSSAKSEDVP